MGNGITVEVNVEGVALGDLDFVGQVDITAEVQPYFLGSEVVSGGAGLAGGWCWWW